MDQILNNLGLCNKAHGLVTGNELVIEQLRKGKVYLIFLASNAGFNTTKMVLDKAKYYNVPVNSNYSAEELSKAIGKERRIVVGVTNKGFLKILMK